MNKVRDYATLEREYVTSQMSLRGLCRRHGISARSGVPVQAEDDWQEKRRADQARASDSFIAHHADRAAAREAEIHDHALDAIDEAITKWTCRVDSSTSRDTESTLAAARHTVQELCPSDARRN